MNQLKIDIKSQYYYIPTCSSKNWPIKQKVWLQHKYVHNKKQLLKLIFLMIVFIIFVLRFLGTVGASQLMFVEIISRHGVRYPAFPNDYDFSNISTLQQARSELTSQGKSMHFILGQRIYHKYWKQLFKNTEFQHHYHQSLIYAKSTNTNRTIESLQCQLSGLLSNLKSSYRNNQPNQYFFPPFMNQNLQPENNSEIIDIQRIVSFPIHVQKGAEGDQNVSNQYNQGDFLVKQERNLCPNQEIWRFRNFQSSLAKRLLKDPRIQKSIGLLQSIYKKPNITLKSAYQYIDNYYCLKAMGRQYLKQFQLPQHKDTFYFMSVVWLYLQYFYTQQQIKTFSTRLLANTLINMERRTQEEGPKIVLYMAHDITIANILAALNYTNAECLAAAFLMNKTNQLCYGQYPSFGSTIIFELWKQENQEFTMRVLINGNYSKIPICGYQLKCGLQQFKNWFNQFRINNPNEQCGISSDKGQNPINMIVSAFLAGLVIPLAYICWVKKQKQYTLKINQTSDDNSELIETVE